MKIPFQLLCFLSAGVILLSGWLLSSLVLGRGGPGVRQELRRYLQANADCERLQRRVAALRRAREEKMQAVKKLLDKQTTFAQAAEAMRYWSEWINETTPDTFPLTPLPPDEQACWERVLTEVTLYLKYHPRKDGAEIVESLRAEIRRRYTERQSRPWIAPGMVDWSTLSVSGPSRAGAPSLYPPLRGSASTLPPD